MKITQRCQLNGKTYTMDIPNLTPEKLEKAMEAYNKGALLQNAFPFLTADEREFLKTGTPPDVWDQIFREPSED